MINEEAISTKVWVIVIEICANTSKSESEKDFNILSRFEFKKIYNGLPW